MADEFAVDDVLAVLLHQNGADDLVDVLAVDAERAALLHFAHQLVGDGADHEALLLGDAEDIVFKAGAVDDLLGGVGDVGSLVHDDRGIARACGDAFFARLHGHGDYGFAAGDSQHFNGLVAHDDGGGVHGGLLRRGDEAVGAACVDDGLIQKLHGSLRGPLGCRMGIVNHGVACGDHADGVVDDRRRRVGGRGDGADNAIGRRFHQGQTVVAAVGGGVEILHAGGLVGGQQVFGDLVRHLAVAGLLMGQNSQFLGVFSGADAHCLHQLAAFLQRHFCKALLGADGGVNGVVYIVKQTLGRPGAAASAALETAAGLFRDLTDLFFCQCHTLSSTFFRKFFKYPGPVQVDGINDGYDALVYGLVFRDVGLTRGAAADQHDDFSLTGTYGVNGYQQAALFLPGFNVDGLDQKQLEAVELFGLVGADNGTLHSC